MTLWQRAVLYITRKPWRGAVLLAVLTLILTLIIVGMAITSSAREEAAAIKKNLAASFKVAMVFPGKEKYIHMAPEERPDITGELMEEICGLPHITDWVAHTEDITVCTELKLREGYNSYRWNQLKAEGDPHNEAALYDVLRRSLTLRGYTDSGLHEFFRNGAFTLSEGRHVSLRDKNSVVISNALAERNGLAVGSTFTVEYRKILDDWEAAGDEILGEPVELTVVGLYDMNFEETVAELEADGLRYESETEPNYAENMVFCDLFTWYQMYCAGVYEKEYWEKGNFDHYLEEMVFPEATVFVDSPDVLQSVIDEVERLPRYQNEYRRITVDDSAYRASVRPVNSLGLMTTVMVAALAAVGAALIVLIVNMQLKSRRRETAILWSVGVGKKSITAQFLLEFCALTILAIVLALGLSYLLAAPLGKIAQAAFSPKGTEPVYEYRIVDFQPVVDVRSADPIDLSYGIKPISVLMTAAAALLCTAAGVAVAAANMMKFNPRKILSGL